MTQPAAVPVLVGRLVTVGCDVAVVVEPPDGEATLPLGESRLGVQIGATDDAEDDGVVDEDDGRLEVDDVLVVGFFDADAAVVVVFDVVRVVERVIAEDLDVTAGVVAADSFGAGVAVALAGRGTVTVVVRLAVRAAEVGLVTSCATEEVAGAKAGERAAYRAPSPIAPTATAAAVVFHPESIISFPSSPQSSVGVSQGNGRASMTKFWTAGGTPVAHDARIRA